MNDTNVFAEMEALNNKTKSKELRRLEEVAAATGRKMSTDAPPADAIHGTYDELIGAMHGELDEAKASAPNVLDRREGENRAQYRKRTRKLKRKVLADHE
jgi:hypothetical protein